MLCLQQNQTEMKKKLFSSFIFRMNVWEPSWSFAAHVFDVIVGGM